MKFLRESVGFERQISVFTNGLLINRNRAAFLNDLGVKVIVSLDSIPESNDRNRRLRNGDGSVYQRVFKAVKLIGHKTVRVHVTLTGNNVTGLPDFLSVLSKEAIEDVGIFPADYTRWKEQDFVTINRTIKDVLYRFGDEFNFVNYRGIFGVNPPSRPECNRIYMGPDGNFYICKCFSVMPASHAKNFIIGSLNDGIDFQKRKRILGNLYKQIRDFEKRHFPEEKQRVILPYIYCPVNTLLYSNLRKHDLDKALMSYYRMMGSFTGPFVSFLGLGEMDGWNGRFRDGQGAVG